MATKKKLLQAAAGAAGGAGLNIEEVFSTYLYTGNNSNPRTITNGIDLAGEGGLVWTKARGTWNSYNLSHILSIGRGSGNASWLSSDTSDAGINTTDAPLFLSDGYQITANNYMNSSTTTVGYASWTFRKAPKFFDVVTWTGDGVAGRTISHNLESTPAFITIKRTDSTGSWYCWHTSLNTSYGLLEQTSAFQTGGAQFVFGNSTSVVQPTSSAFTVGTGVNTSGGTYVAYLFAHNDGDGEFGPDADADIIKCGSYTNDSSNDVYVDLGWEPQWVLVKNASTSGDWNIVDNMRGLVSDETNNLSKELNPNTTAAETSIRVIQPTSTGFYVQNAIDGNYNENTTTGTKTHIYIAIRRGPMAVPESASDVFAVNNGDGSSSNPGLISGFPVDFGWQKFTTLVSDDHVAWTRLTQGKSLALNTTTGEISATQAYFDYMNGMGTSAYSTNLYAWMFKRAPNFFDVVAYTGNSTNPTNISHNLGVAPEMMWIKMRSSTNPWGIYHSATGNTKMLNFDTGVGFTSNLYWGSTTPTDQVFTLGNSGGVNSAGDTYIAYLFATLAGISKVGSYTGNGSTQTIDCGFSSGARFVLIKRTDSTGDWYIWDTERGIVSGNDPHLSLNTTAAEVTTDDSIDPVSSGFAVNQVSATNINVSSATYIFYAVA